MQYNKNDRKNNLRSFVNGPTTFRKTTFSIMALGITIKNAVMSLHSAEYRNGAHFDERRYAECNGTVHLCVVPT
jgi:hypothetical protein